MPESIIPEFCWIYQEYIKKRWWGLSLTEFSLVRSEWGAGKESESVQEVICFRILLYNEVNQLEVPTGCETCWVGPVPASSFGGIDLESSVDLERREVSAMS